MAVANVFTPETTLLEILATPGVVFREFQTELSAEIEPPEKGEEVRWHRWGADAKPPEQWFPDGTVRLETIRWSIFHFSHVFRVNDRPLMLRQLDDRRYLIKLGHPSYSGTHLYVVVLSSPNSDNAVT